MPRASGLEAELVDAFNAEVKIIGGSGGVYDIVVDDVLVFSKKAEGRFPDTGEIVRLLNVS